MAAIEFLNRVKTGDEWDHKPILTSKFHLASGDYRTKISAEHDWRLLYDVWSNIHYGYVGRAAGFSRSELLVAQGASLPGVGATDTSGGDNISVDVGMDLWDRYGKDLTIREFHEAIVSAVPRWASVEGRGWGMKVVR